MKSIIAALLFCFIATGASALEEYPVSVPAFAVIVDDTANFQADGTPKRLRWGICLYEATVESEAGDFRAKWRFTRPAGHPSSVLHLVFDGDRALPEEGRYHVSLKVLNMGEEAGMVLVKSTPGALNFLVNYSAPEVALVTPSDLQAGMIAVVEHETDF